MCEGCEACGFFLYLALCAEKASFTGQDQACWHWSLSPWLSFPGILYETGENMGGFQAAYHSSAHPRLSLGVWDEGAPCLPIQGEEAGSGKGVTENRHFGDQNFRV